MMSPYWVCLNARSHLDHTAGRLDPTIDKADVSTVCNRVSIKDQQVSQLACFD
jgi:hypothetical protein